ncbi:hypothetical protein BLNAU_22201 [Blattamonas nauphoetae]|uniref:Uncharacterized protein n=1 Tax=Blattamonas nauphoetae TaxID=2049346 RepID=A0ABQ9WTQ1_9EUKA|nr:hypothetical protein BLNAU_22201 [Blattamonas nauphoetae]
MGENNSSLLSLKKKLIASKLYLALRLHSTNQASPFTSPFLVAQDSLNIATSKENMGRMRKKAVPIFQFILPELADSPMFSSLVLSLYPPLPHASFFAAYQRDLHDVTEGRGEEVAEHQHSRLHIATLTEYTRAAAPSILLHSRQTACPVCGLGGAGVGAVPKCRGGGCCTVLSLLINYIFVESAQTSQSAPPPINSQAISKTRVVGVNIVLLNRVRSTATNIPLSTPVQLSHCISRPILRPRCSPLLPHSPIVPGFDTATRLLLGGQGTVQADHLLHVRTDTLRLFTLRLPPPLNECALVMLSTKVLCEYKQVGVHQQSNVEFFQLIINRKDPAIALVAAQFLMEYSFILKD